MQYLLLSVQNGFKLTIWICACAWDVYFIRWLETRISARVEVKNIQIYIFYGWIIFGDNGPDNRSRFPNSILYKDKKIFTGYIKKI